MSVTSPFHVCAGSPVGRSVELTWTVGDRVCRITGKVETVDPRRDRWCVSRSDVDVFETEKRFRDASPATLHVAGRVLPVTVVDRSLHGAGCVAPPDAVLKIGTPAVISVGAHERAGVIVRVRREGRGVRLGLRLDPA